MALDKILYFCQFKKGMKNIWVWVVIIVLLAGVGYYYKHQIKVLLMGGSPTAVTYGPSTAPSTTTATGAVITWATGAKGQYAVGGNGMTLYRFDKDTTGVSNCNGSCAGIWPPYTTTSAPATLPVNVTLVTRSDGSMQFAYKGAPLYYYSGDTKAGDVNGDGFNGIWHLVMP